MSELTDIRQRASAALASIMPDEQRHPLVIDASDEIADATCGALLAGLSAPTGVDEVQECTHFIRALFETTYARGVLAGRASVVDKELWDFDDEE